jgi:hypothetical protein
MKRTELKRAQPLRVTGEARATVKLRKCKACRSLFVPRSMTHKACSIDCSLVLVKASNAKAIASAELRAARAHREKLADSKPLSHWLRATERVVNHFILTRDTKYGCISCGTNSTVLWQAGHYLSVAAHPELRFNPGNINKQCCRCNVQLSGNQAAYRIGHVERHGAELVEALEGPNATAKFTREKLAEIRQLFAAKTRFLKARA